MILNVIFRANHCEMYQSQFAQFVLDRTSSEGAGTAGTTASSDSSVIVEIPTPKHLRRPRLVHCFPSAMKIHVPF